MFEFDAAWIRIPPLLDRISALFDIWGANRSAFHMEMCGVGQDGKEKKATFYI